MYCLVEISAVPLAPVLLSSSASLRLCGRMVLKFVCVWFVGFFASFADLREMVSAFGFSTSPVSDLVFPSASLRLCGRMVLMFACNWFLCGFARDSAWFQF